MTVTPTAATLVLMRDGAGAIEVLLLQRPDRGSFAGGWVFPGGRVETVDIVDDEEVTARNAAVRETAEESGLVVDPGALLPLSHWSPPEQLATKFITWFFVAEAPDGDVALQAAEAVASQWIRPADALKQHGAGRLRLFPPTWVTLDTLMAYPTVEAARRSIGARELQRYATVQDPERGLAIWEGDEAYDGAPDTEEGPRHRLHVGTLPWRFEHR
ncbi:MAG: NUDIX hydrolase [Actinomycetota bacterium]